MRWFDCGIDHGKGRDQRMAAQSQKVLERHPRSPVWHYPEGNRQWWNSSCKEGKLEMCTSYRHALSLPRAEKTMFPFLPPWEFIYNSFTGSKCSEILGFCISLHQWFLHPSIGQNCPKGLFNYKVSGRPKNLYFWHALGWG